MGIPDYILTIDQGTTGTRAGLVDKCGQLLCSTYQEITPRYPRPGWVENDPNEIMDSVYSTVEELFSEFEITSENIVSIGLTNQRETTLLWDKTNGAPAYNAISWQCRRSTDICKSLIEREYTDFVRKVTGLTIDPYFSASKIQWVLENVPGARTSAQLGNLAFGTIDSWIVWNLTNGRSHVIEISNASRTMLFDINKVEWSDDLLDLFEIPRSILPEVVPSSGRLTTVGGNFFSGRAIPITGMCGDQQSSLFGQCCFDPGMIKITYGTGAFLLVNIGETPLIVHDGILTTIAWQLEGEINYALEGSVFSAGATVQWVRDQIGLIKESSDIERLASDVNNNGGVYLVPAFNGLGAPHWDPQARASIQGLTSGSNKGHIARAALESIAYQCEDVIQSMGRSVENTSKVRVDGGASANNLLMQFQSDISHIEIERSSSVESTSLGAAYLAGLGAGFWANKDEIREIWKGSGLFSPTIDEKKRNALKSDWLKAISRSKRWAIDAG